MVTRLRSLIKKLKANKARQLIVLLAIFALLAPVGVTTVTADPPPGCADVDKDCIEPPVDLCPDQTEDFQGVIDGCPEDGKQPPTNNAGDCTVVNDYPLNGLNEIATSGGSFLHVEFWLEGQPERETLLPAGNYAFTGTVNGHVWEYSSTCTQDQVMEQINAHIQRRLDQKANNAGYVDWPKNLFILTGPDNSTPSGPDMGSGDCFVINDYPLVTLPEVATSGMFMLVEFSQDGQNEWVTILPHGRYALSAPLDGHVWEYGVNCTFDQINQLATDELNRLSASGVQNAGYASWESTGLFKQISTDAPLSGGISSGSDSQECHAKHDYPLQTVTELATSGAFLHVEFYKDGQPERETILPHGRYTFDSALKGHVWEYPTSCSFDDVRAQVKDHVQRRLADKANNAGYVDWPKNLFKQISSS